MLLYSKQLFVLSVDIPSLLALNGSPKFLTRLIPISNLTSACLSERIKLTVQTITPVQTDVKIIICDGNRVNQAFFKLYPTRHEKHCLTEDNKHMLLMLNQVTNVHLVIINFVRKVQKYLKIWKI